MTIKTGHVTQREFAARLRYVIDDVLGWNRKQGPIAKRAGIHSVTLSRWRNASYKSGPPRQIDLRELEPALNLKKGSLLADEDTWQLALEHLKNHVANTTPPKNALPRW